MRRVPGQKFSHFFHFHNSYENISIFHSCIVLDLPFLTFFLFFLVFSFPDSLFFLSPWNPKGEGLAKCDLSARKMSVKTTKLFNVRLDYLTQFIKTSRYYILKVGSLKESFFNFFTFLFSLFSSLDFILILDYYMLQYFSAFLFRDTCHFTVKWTTTA